MICLVHNENSEHPAGDPGSIPGGCIVFLDDPLWMTRRFEHRARTSRVVFIAPVVVVVVEETHDARRSILELFNEPHRRLRRRGRLRRRIARARLVLALARRRVDGRRRRARVLTLTLTHRRRRRRRRASPASRRRSREKVIFVCRGRGETVRERWSLSFSPSLTVHTPSTNHDSSRATVDSNLKSASPSCFPTRTVVATPHCLDSPTRPTPTPLRCDAMKGDDARVAASASPTEL